MKAEQIGLIALDMDGTLIGSDHLTVSEENKRVLKLAHTQGAKLAIATGRTIATLGDICEQVPEIDFVIFSNGAGILDVKKNEVIYHNLIDRQKAAELLDYLENYPVYLKIYADGEAFAQNDRSIINGNGLFPSDFVTKLMRKTKTDISLKEVVRCHEVEVFVLYPRDENCYRELWNQLGQREELTLLTSWENTMEFNKSGADKGSAMAFLCEKLGITCDNCMAFGDAGNDSPMLEFVKYGFAMLNGTDECKQSAQFITEKTNTEDGVAHEIKKFFRGTL